MSHYFTNEDLVSNIVEINVNILEKDFIFYSDNGVFSKKKLDFGSRTLIKSLLEEKLSGTLLDVGCGYGVIGIILSSFFELETDMIDINKRAVHLANRNIKKNKLKNIKAYESDIYSNVSSKYDFIVTNPPIRAGKEVVYKILFSCKEYLNPYGTLYFVINKDQGAKSAIKDLSVIGKLEVLNKNKGFYVIKCQFD